MGLDTTHDCWHGPYSAFMRWRRAVAKTIGLDLDAMVGFGGTVEWPDAASEPLVHLLNHSDCDGVLAVEVLVPLAERLEAIAPLIEDEPILPYGHAEHAREFAEGCRRAAELGEPVEFH